MPAPPPPVFPVVPALIEAGVRHWVTLTLSRLELTDLLLQAHAGFRRDLRGVGLADSFVTLTVTVGQRTYPPCTRRASTLVTPAPDGRSWSQAFAFWLETPFDADLARTQVAISVYWHAAAHSWGAADRLGVWAASESGRLNLASRLRQQPHLGRIAQPFDLRGPQLPFQSAGELWRCAVQAQGAPQFVLECLAGPGHTTILDALLRGGLPTVIPPPEAFGAPTLAISEDSPVAARLTMTLSCRSPAALVQHAVSRAATVAASLRHGKDAVCLTNNCLVNLF